MSSIFEFLGKFPIKIMKKNPPWSKNANGFVFCYFQILTRSETLSKITKYNKTINKQINPCSCVSSQLLIIVILYMICSSLLLVVNVVAILHGTSGPRAVYLGGVVTASKTELDSRLTGPT